LANIIYSYHKAESASKELLTDLMPTVMKQMNYMKPRELTTILMAYTDQGFFRPISDGDDAGSSAFHN